MKIMKLSKIFITAIAGLLTVGCYNDFDLPKDVADNQPIEYNDEYMETVLGLEHKTIAEVKAMFGQISGTGSTNVDKGLDATIYKHFVTDKSECTSWELEENRYIEGNYYIKGKVVSNDEQGNLYKSLYIFDGTEAIELKLTNGLYIDYPCDVKDGGKTLWVYVKLTGLYMANFRMMLSIGFIPTEGMNSVGRDKFYGNSNLVTPEHVRQHVFKGAVDYLTEGRLADNGSNYRDYDILDIDENNYSILRAPQYFGRTMRFLGVKVMYKGVTDQDGIPQPVFGTDDIFPSWSCTSGKLQGFINTEYLARPWGKLAYSINNNSLYGALLVGYGNPTKGSQAGAYQMRTSGYSRYANRYVPRNGATGSILGIYAIYSTESDYTGGSRDYANYQLTPFRFEDILPEYYSAMTAEDEAEMAAWASTSDKKALTDKKYGRYADYDEKGQIPYESFYLPQTQDDDYED